jgi:hypothetical protein
VISTVAGGKLQKPRSRKKKKKTIRTTPQNLHGGGEHTSTAELEMSFYIVRCKQAKKSPIPLETTTTTTTTAQCS